MDTTTINGLHSCKPGNEPIIGQVKSFVIQHMTSKKGKPYLKIKAAGAESGGTPHRILAAEQTDFVDSWGNLSFNLEIEPAVNGQQGEPKANLPHDARYDTPEQAVNSPQAPPARQIDGEIETYAKHSLKVFQVGWNKAGEWIQGLPEKDRQDMTVEVYYDLYMRVAQHISIDVGKIIRRERF